MAIHYATASLKKHSTLSERRTIYFYWNSDTSTQMNRVKFPLTGRYREYLVNIPEQEIKDWPQHEKTVQAAKEHENPVWIGKGNETGKFQPGHKPNVNRYENTSAILEYNDNDTYTLKVWIDSMYAELILYPNDNETYTYKGEKYYSETKKISGIRGKWK